MFLPYNRVNPAYFEGEELIQSINAAFFRPNRITLEFVVDQKK